VSGCPVIGRLRVSEPGQVPRVQRCGGGQLFPRWRKGECHVGDVPGRLAQPGHDM